MTTTQIASISNYFINQFTSLLADNLGLVISFAATVLVWVIVKKWLFGGFKRV